MGAGAATAPADSSWDVDDEEVAGGEEENLSPGTTSGFIDLNKDINYMILRTNKNIFV